MSPIFPCGRTPPFGSSGSYVPVSGALMMAYAIRHLVDALRGDIAETSGIMSHELPPAIAAQAKSE